MKLKNFVIVFVLVVGALAGTGAVGWALAAPPERESPTATVSVDLGEAWIQRGGEGEWSPVAAETPVTLGDRIKTGPKSQASVVFFDNSTARLDELSEVVVRDLAIDDQNNAFQRVSIEVVAGRVWSRILKFLEKGSSYSAQTSEVVATVRGTAFVMDLTDPEVYSVKVIDDSVAVSLAGGEGEEFVTSGEEALFGRAAPATSTPRRILRRRIAERVLAEPWFEKMRQSDREFSERIKAKDLRELREKAGALPGSPLYGLKRLGEKLRLSLVSDPEQRRDITVRFADRRFAELVTLGQTGRKKNAERLIPEFRGKYLRLIREVESSKLPAEGARRLCRLLRGRFLEQDIKLRDIGDQELKALIASPSAAADMRELPAELRDRVCGGERELPEFRQILPGSLKGPAPEAIINVNGPLPTEKSPLPSEPTLINSNLNSPVKPPPEPLNLNANVVSQPVAPTVTSISVWGPRNILYLSDSQQLNAKAAYSDGSVKDVTFVSAWSSSNVNVLSVSDGMVLTAGLGDAVVKAVYGGVAGTFAIKVVPPPVLAAPTLQSLSVGCSPSSIGAYQSSVCQAAAHYSDGSSKDVTVQSIFTSSGQSGSMDGNTFYSSSLPGTATVNASYTEGTVTVKGSATVQVL